MMSVLTDVLGQTLLDVREANKTLFASMQRLQPFSPEPQSLSKDSPEPQSFSKDSQEFVIKYVQKFRRLTV